MKRTVSKLLLVILCLIMCVSMAGCNTDLQTVLLIKNTYDAILTINSLEFSVTADVDAVAWNEPVKFAITGDGKYIVDPMMAELDAQIDFDDNMTLETPIYVFLQDDLLKYYVGLSAGDNTIWFKGSSASDPQAFSGGLGDLVGYMKNYSEPVKIGKEGEINGQAAQALCLTVPGAVFMQTDKNGAVIEGSKPVSDLSVTVWIDKESNMPLRLEGDIGDIIRYNLEMLNKNMAKSITINSISVVIDISNFNGVDFIEMPTDTENAIDFMDFITSGSEPEPSESPAPTESPEPSESPAPSESPKPSESPAPTESPKPSESPAPSESPKPSETPAPTASPEASTKPTKKHS